MLLDALIEKQQNAGYNDQEFAALLGIPRSTWQLTRTHVKPLGRKVAIAARKAFPELRPAVVSFLLSDATGIAAPATRIAS